MFLRGLVGARTPLPNAGAVWSAGYPHVLRHLSARRPLALPEFPGHPCEHMPCSQTPVVSGTLAKTHPGTAAFPTLAQGRRSHSDVTRNALLMTTTLQHFRAQSHSLRPRLVQLRTPVTGLTREPPYRPQGNRSMSLKNDFTEKPLYVNDSRQKYAQLKICRKALFCPPFIRIDSVNV